MKINTKNLKEAFSIVNCVESHAGLLSSQYLKLTFDSTGQMQMGLSGLVFSESRTSADKASSRTFFIDRRVFEAFISSARAETVDILPDKDSLLLKCGRTKVQLTGVDEIGGYTTWKQNNGQALTITEPIRKDIAMLSQYAPVTAAADHLSAVYMVKTYGIVATDSFVMAARIDPNIKVTAPLPVVLSKLIQETKSNKILIEETGAGIKFPIGYLYQTLSDRLVTDYPLDSLKKLISQGLKAHTKLSFQASELHHGLEHIRKFIFGSDIDVVLECSARPTDRLCTLSLALNQGKTNKRVPATAPTEVTFRWPITPLEPWVTHITETKAETTIECFSLENINGFRATIDKVRYVLLITESQ